MTTKSEVSLKRSLEWAVGLSMASLTLFGIRLLGGRRNVVVLPSYLAEANATGTFVPKDAGTLKFLKDVLKLDEESIDAFTWEKATPEQKSLYLQYIFTVPGIPR